MKKQIEERNTENEKLIDLGKRRLDAEGFKVENISRE